MTQTQQKPLLIKLGGAVLESKEALSNLFSALTKYLATEQRPLLIVHGGGVIVEDVLNKMNIKSEKKNGLRITPFDHIPYVAGALAGTSNKLLMAKALQAGLSAVGLSLADGFSCSVKQMDPELGAVGICSPNNPTGAVATKEQLKKFVDYAREHKAIIFYDSAYAAFITDPDLPKSIYEIEGAQFKNVFHTTGQSLGTAGKEIGHSVVDNSKQVANNANEKIQGE